MRILVKIIAVIALLVGAAYIAGAQLPDSQSVTLNAVYHQPAKEVWNTMTTYHEFPAWTKIERVERLPDREDKPVWRIYGPYGKPMDLMVVENTPLKKHVSRIVGDDLPYGGEWVFEMTADKKEAKVTLTANSSNMSPICRFMSHYIMGADAMPRQFLEQLGQRFGEQVAVNQGK